MKYVLVELAIISVPSHRPGHSFRYIYICIVFIITNKMSKFSYKWFNCKIVELEIYCGFEIHKHFNSVFDRIRLQNIIATFHRAQPWFYLVTMVNSMAYCKTTISPELTHRRCCNLALSQRNSVCSWRKPYARFIRLWLGLGYYSCDYPSTRPLYPWTASNAMFILYNFTCIYWYWPK